MIGAFLAILLAIAAASARFAAQRSPSLLNTARLLAVGLALDAVGRAAGLVYLGTRSTGEHYSGGARVAFHTAQVAWLAWPCLVAADVGATLTRAPRWPWAGALVALALVAVLVYPGADPEALSCSYAAARVVSSVSCCISVVAWSRRARWTRPDELCALALAGCEVALALAAHLPGAASWAVTAPAPLVVCWLSISVIALGTWLGRAPATTGSSSP